MSLFGMFKPKWKHSDLSIRKAEVNKLSDETILLKIINTDNNHEIRKIAIERLTKESNLFEIIKHNPEDKIIYYAIDRLQSSTILSDIVSSSLPLGIRIAALIKFKDQKKESQTNKNQAQIRKKEKKKNLLENNMAHQFNDRGVCLSRRPNIIAIEHSNFICKKGEEREGTAMGTKVKIPYPKEDELKKLNMFVVLLPKGDGVCSDTACPCPGTPIPHGSGYIYISPMAVKFRKDARTNSIVSNPEITGAILVCEEGAKLRKLNLQVATVDAKLAWSKGYVPCRPTPIDETKPLHKSGASKDVNIYSEDKSKNKERRVIDRSTDLYNYQQFIHGKTCFTCCEDLSELSIKNYGDRYGFDAKNFPSKECLYVECLKGHDNSLIELSKRQ